jgi:hypothetical protein
VGRDRKLVVSVQKEDGGRFRHGMD